MSGTLPPASTPGYRWVILAIATFAQACACFFVQGIGAIAVFMQRDLHLSAMQIGALVSAAQLVPVAGLLVAGELLDRFSERMVVGLGTSVVALALSATVFASSYGSVLLFLLVAGAGYSTAQPGGSKSISAWFAKSQRGLAMGVRQAGLPLGGALAAATLPAVANAWGWRSSFLAGGTVALLGAVVFMVFYRAPARTAPDIRRKEASLAAAIASRLAMLKEPTMRNIVLSGISLISVQYGILIFTVLYLHDTLALSITVAASLLFLAQAAGVAGRILLAAWSDRSSSGRYLPVLVCMVGVIVGLLLLIWMPMRSPLLVGSLVAWLGFFGFGWYGPWVAYVAESAPPEKTGFALGFAMAINQVAIVLAPPTLGLLRDWTHSYLPGWSMLAAMTMAALLATAWSASRSLWLVGRKMNK
jgi:sugar phosphate permease